MLLKVPRGQGLQEQALVAPVCAPYLPASQGAQELRPLALAYVPREHTAQVVEPTLLVKRPGSQAAHASPSTSAFSFTPYLPAAHV